MAEELDPVTQKFIADVTRYVADVQAAADDAKKFAAANVEAKAAADGMRDSSAEAGAAVGGLRDKVAEAAAAAGIYRDEMGKLRDAQGGFVAESVLQDLALGKTRDKALEAAAAMRGLKDEEEAVSRSGLLSRLGGLFGGGGGGGIPMGSGLMSLPAMLAIVPAVEALLPLVAGLAAGFASAGAGAGAFFLLAHPAINNLKQDYQSLTAAQQKYQHAQAIEAADPTKAHLKAVHDALVNLQVVRQGMTQDEGTAAAGAAQLSQEYHKLAAAFTPDAFKVFSGFLNLANQLLPDVAPFAKTFADALSGLLGKAGQFAGSTGFKDWLQQFHALEGPSITAIGDGLGKVAVSAGKLLTVMSSKDVVNAINIAFGILSGTINVVTYMIKRLMDNWDGMSAAARHSWYDIKRWTDDVTGAFDATRHAVADFAHNVAAHFDEVRHDVASWGHDVAHDFDTVRHTIASWGHDVAGTFDTVRHAAAVAGDAIARPFIQAYDWILRNWKNVAAWLLMPVAMAVYEIRTHLKDIVQAFENLGHDIAVIFDGARHDIAAIADGIGHDVTSAFDSDRHEIAVIFDGWRHDIAAAVDAIPGDIRKEWDMIRHDAAALGNDVLHALSAAWTAIWHNLTSTTSSGAGQVTGFFQKLPGEILGFLKSLPGDMLTIGRNIVTGLYNGIVSMFNQVIGQVESLASTISKAFTNPLSIFSPSRVFFEHGANIVRGAINGVKAYAPQLVAAVRSLGTGVAGAGSALAAGAVGAAGGGSTTHVTVPITLQGGAAAGASPQYLQGLQATVQEAVLRYNQLNPGNGLSTTWGR